MSLPFVTVKLYEKWSKLAYDKTFSCNLREMRLQYGYKKEQNRKQEYMVS